MLAAVLISIGVPELNAQILTPQPSPAGTVSSVVGLTNITVEYSRPKVKGRQIFGDGDSYLQPYGQIWRTGANQGTKISFEDEISMGGQKIPAGEYLIFSIPNAEMWTVMLYSDISLGGNVAGYDKAMETARVKVKSKKLSDPVETLTINISDISEDNTTAALEIAWADISVKVPIVVDFDEKVMASIERNTKVNPNNYSAAANYYFSTGRDLDQAVKWMDKLLKERPNQFWNVHTKALMLKKKGDYIAAIETAKKSLELAKAAGNDFGYIKLNNDLLAELSELASTSGKKKKSKKK